MTTSLQGPRTDFSPLSVPPPAGLTVPPCPPLPTMREAEGPRVTNPLPGVLAPVTDAGFLDLAAYHWAGWEGAIETSLLRVEILERLSQVAASLPTGFGLAIFDGWRPLDLQRRLFDTLVDAAPKGYISKPSSDPATPPPHLTGATADLTLTFDGQPLSLGTPFDHFGPAAHPDALEHDPPVTDGLDIADVHLCRDLRRLLVSAVHEADFVVHDLEWWHVEHGTRRWADLTGGVPTMGPATTA